MLLSGSYLNLGLASNVQYMTKIPSQQTDSTFYLDDIVKMSYAVFIYFFFTDRSIVQWRWWKQWWKGSLSHFSCFLFTFVQLFSVGSVVLCVAAAKPINWWVKKMHRFLAIKILQNMTGKLIDISKWFSGSECVF